MPPRPPAANPHGAPRRGAGPAGGPRARAGEASPRGGGAPPRRTPSSRSTRPSTRGCSRRILVRVLIRIRAGVVRLTLAQRAHGRLPLLTHGPIEHQHAVEMVDLVLKDPRLQSGGLDLEGRAGEVHTADPGEQRTLDVDGHARDA